MEFRSLVPDDFPAIHAAFLEAFSDYDVPFQISAGDLQAMLTRRGYLPGASVGVFDNGRMVAFTLNGVGDWRGVRTGYDTGTGVVPSHRGRGLSSRMLDESIERLRGEGARQYLLEVLQSNTRAFRIYHAAGFKVTRELQCWKFDAQRVPEAAAAADTADWNRVAALFDAQPSWQNSIDSVRRAIEENEAVHSIVAVYEATALAGCAVVFENGDLPFLAVERSSRRRGIGTRLLTTAAAGRPLRILNVDAAFGGIAAFLERCGATQTVAQYEMIRPI